MLTPRETRSGYARSSAASVAPPRSVTSLRHQATGAVDAARRQREREAVVLAQIVARATRHRRRGADSSSAPAMALDADPPLTLIELIQASTAVFEKHGIQAPEDAAYHRHLLTLSLDKERDWKTKIQRFALTQVPRASRVGSELGGTMTISPHVSSAGSVANTAAKRASMAASEAGFQTSSRRRSGVGAEPRPAGWIPPGIASRPSSRQGKCQSVDQFGDMLEAPGLGPRPQTPKETALKENQLRNATMAEASIAPENEGVVNSHSVTAAQKLRDLEAIRAKLSEISGELGGEEDPEEADDDDDNGSDEGGAGGASSYVSYGIDTQDDDDTFSESVSTSARSIAPHAFYPSPARAPSTVQEDSDYFESVVRPMDSPIEAIHEPTRPTFAVESFRRLARTFQEWKEITNFHRLVREGQQREMRLTQSVLPPVATFAIFRWIVITLPGRQDRPSSISGLAVPTCVESRGIAASNPRLLRHFTGRLLVWTVHRIFKTWAYSARAIKTHRIKSLIRARTEVLHTAFKCLQRWHHFTRQRRRTNDHGLWVETLHARRCLRRTIRIWRKELHTRRREQDIMQSYRRRRLKTTLTSWRTWTRQRRMVQYHGSRRLLRRYLREWRRSLLWSEQEHKQIVQARSHLARRELTRCWLRWRERSRGFKVRRLQVLKATKCFYTRTVRRIWAAWRENRTTRKNLAQKCARFTKRRRTRIVRCILLSWSQYAHHKKCCVLTVMDAWVRREERLQKRIWRAWTSHFALALAADETRTKRWETYQKRQVWTAWKRKASLLRLSTAVKSCFETSTTQTAFSTWRKWTQRQRYYRCLVGDWRGERDEFLKRHVFEALRQNLNVGRLKLQAAQRFLNQSGGTRLRSYMLAWRELTRIRSKSRRDDELRAQEWRRSQLRGCWKTWRQAFHVAHCIQIADGAMTQSVQRRHFHLWRTHILTRHALRARAPQFHRFKLKRAISKWCNRVEANRIDRSVIATVANRRDVLMLQGTWHVWRHLNAKAIQRETQAARAVLQWQGKRVELCFLEWKALHIKRKKLLALLMMWKEGGNVKSLSSSWRAWHAYVALKHERKMLIEESHHHYEHRSLKRAIRCWRSRRERSHEQVLAIKKCITHWSSNQRLRLFVRWKQDVRLRRLVRAMASLNGRKLVQRCFMTWCKWKHHRGMAALELEDLKGQLCHWKAQRAVKKLREYAVVSKRLSSLQGLVKLAGSRGLQTTTLRRWILFTAAKKKVQVDRNLQVAHMEKFRKQLCVKRWEKRTKLKKLLASTLTQTKTRKTSETLARIFSQWLQYVTERKMFIALKQKAHVFQALSMLPTYFYAWRRFIETQRRSQLLVLKASRLLCHQLESRAFRAWNVFTSRTKQARSAIQLWRNQSMLGRFARWRAFVAHQKAKATGIAHYELKARKQVVRGWRAAAHRQKLLKHFTQLWHAQTTEQCFERWATHTKMTKCARALLRRLQQSSLNRVFNSWKALSARRQEVRGDIKRRFALLWNQDRKMTSFQRWKALITQQKLLKKRMIQRMTKQTARYFSHWRSATVREKAIAGRGIKVREIRTRRLLIAFWTAWKRRKLKHDTVNAFRRRAMNQSSEALVRILLQEWRVVTRKALSIKLAGIQKDRCTLRRVFTSWRDRFVVPRRTQRTVASDISKHHELRLINSVLLRMRARMTIKNAVTRVFLPQLQRHVMLQAWRSWLRYHMRKQDQNEAIHRVRLTVVTCQESVKRFALKSVSRWRSLQQAKCLDHWRMLINQLKWMRKNTVTAIQLWETRLSTATFYSWRRWVTYHKLKCTVEGRFTKHRQARAWLLWSLFHRDQQYQRRQSEKALTFHRKHAQAVAMTAWRRVQARHRHCALLEASLTLYRTQRSLRKWHGFAVHMRSHRVQLTVATVAAENKRISTCWRQWKRFVSHLQSHRRELQQHTERLQVLILCSTFRAWFSWSQRQSKVNRVLSLMSRRCGATTARRILHTWASYSKGKSMQRDAVAKYVYESKTRRGIQALRSHALEEVAKRDGCRKARQWVEVLQGRYVRRSFQSWQRFTTLAKKVRNAVRRYNTSKLLPNTFNAWKAFIMLRKSKNHRLDRAVSCWRSVFVRRAWNAWLDHHSQRKAIRVANVKAQDHFILHLLRLVLSCWRSTTSKKRSMKEGCRKMLVRWKMQTAYRCFASWQSHTLHRKAICVSAAIVSSRFENIHLREAWGEWRRQFVVNQVGLRKRLARAFDRWRQWQHDRREWERFQTSQSRALMLNVRCRQGIRAWRAFVVQAKMAKTMTLLSSRFSKDTVVKRCFERWLQYLVIRHREKEKMMRVVVWIRNRHLMSCFRSLVQYAYGRRQKKQHQKIASTQARRRMVLVVFTAWKKVASVVKEQRLKLRRYVDVMQHLSQRKSFIAWRDYAWKCVHLKSTCASLLSQRTMFTTRALFDEWIDYTRKMKQTKTADVFNCRRLYHETIRQWGKFLVLTRIERMLGAGEQRLLERCFVGWRKRTVIHTTVRQLGREKHERGRWETLKNHLHAWKSWTHIQTKCSSLLANVALGHTLRFRFLLWKKYVEMTKTLRRLVLGVGSLSATTQGSAEGTVDAGDELLSVTLEHQPSTQLSRMARFFQRFVIDWDDTRSVWQRWRHVFHACLFYRMRRLFKIFTAWQAWSQRRRYVKHICLSRQRTRQFVLSKTVLMHWREVVTTVKAIQRERQRERELLVIVNAQMLRHDRKTLQRHWSAWRERTENKRHLLVSVDTYQRARLLTKFWLLWSHDFVSIRKHEYQLQTMRCNQLRAMKARRVIRSLDERRIRGLRTRHAIAILQMRRHGRWLDQTFHGWKHYADTSRKARLLGVFKDRQVLRQVYLAWRAWLEARYQQGCAITEFVSRRTKLRRADMFRRWRGYLEHRRRRDDAMALAASYHIRRQLHHRWLRAIQTRITTRKMLKRPLEALIKWRQQRAITRWHHIVTHDLRLQKLRAFVQRKHFVAWKCHVQELVADRFRARLQQIRRKTMFLSWSYVTRRQRRLGRIQVQISDARAEKLGRQVWKEWQLFVQRKRHLRLAQDHSSHVLKLKTLLYWYDAAKAAIQARDDRLAVAEQFQSFIKKRAVLRRWVSALVQARQRRAVLLVCVFKIQRAMAQRLQQVTLQEWSDAADLQRFNRECEGILQQRRMERAITKWRRKIHERQRFQLLERDAISYRSSRLLSEVFFRWQNYALAWKDAETSRQRISTRRTKAAPPLPPPPPPPVDTSQDEAASEGENESELRFRRPLSPMKKRLRAKQPKDSLAEPPVPSFADAAALSLDVKKRLLVLGKWKPAHKSLSQV